MSASSVSNCVNRSLLLIVVVVVIVLFAWYSSNHEVLASNLFTETLSKEPLEFRAGITKTPIATVAVVYKKNSSILKSARVNDDEVNDSAIVQNHANIDATEDPGLELKRWESLQEERRKRLRDVCEQLNKTGGDHSHDFEKVAHNILVNKEYKLLYCYIAKAGSSNWRKVFMMLEGRGYKRPEDIPRKKIDYFHLPLLSDHLNQINIHDYHAFLFVKHPLDRLLSAWHNKFAERLFKNMIYVKKEIIKFTRFNGSNPATMDVGEIWFSEFLRYLTQSRHSSVHNDHWATYMEFCQPCRVPYEYIGKTENIVEESQFILNKTGAAAKVYFPRGRLLNPLHTSLTSDEIKSHWKTIPPGLFKATVDRYLNDFKVFGYPVPSSVEEYIGTLT